MKHLLVLLAFITQGVLGSYAQAMQTTLESLMARDSAPPGVVFEIADSDPQALELAIPWVGQAAERLKARFPDMPMAVVTHGKEMFALQSDKKSGNGEIHQQVQSLSRDKGIPVHVCEIHAGWKSVAPEAFPAYVDVAPSGPSQIRSYEALDYVRLVVPRATVLRRMAR